MSETPAFDVEEWRPVIDYENQYEVSNLGQVRSIGKGMVFGRTRKLQTNRFGYQTAILYKNGKFQSFLIHVLVAKAFIGPIPTGKEINHIDGIKEHNYFRNLEFVTRSENNLHAYRTGLKTTKSYQGELNPKSKLTEKNITEIRDLSNKGITGRSLARQFGVNHTTIRAILLGRTWRNVP